MFDEARKNIQTRVHKLVLIGHKMEIPGLIYYKWVRDACHMGSWPIGGQYGHREYSSSWPTKCKSPIDQLYFR